MNTNDSQNIEILSSHGTLIVNQEGIVIDRVNMHTGEDNYLGEIVSVDLKEHCRFWNVKLEELTDIDCLDIYLTDNSGKIDKPEDMIRETAHKQEFHLYTVDGDNIKLVEEGGKPLVINGYHNASDARKALSKATYLNYYFKIAS